MLLILLALQFVLVSVSLLRWTRVAQQGGYRHGVLTDAHRAASAKGSPDRVRFLVVVVLAVVGLIVPILALAACLVWLQWPSSLPLRDRTRPLVWDKASRSFFMTSVATLFLIAAALLLVLIVVGVYALSALPLVAIYAGEWALRMLPAPKAAA